MLTNHLLSITHHNSHPWHSITLSQWLWIMVRYAEPVVVGMLRKWMWIMMCNAEQVVVNHGLLCWPSGCESCLLCWTEQFWIILCYTETIVFEKWCVMTSQWLWIIVCYAEPVNAIHSELCWASDCESRCAMLSHWLWIMVCYAVPVGVNYEV
jgi:hypothetical protein